MGKIVRQARAELKQLPLMLGKVLGGFAAVIGFMMAVLNLTRSSNLSPGNLLPSLLICGAGIVVFVLSGRTLTRRSALAGQEQESPPADRIRGNVLSWALLLLLVGIFLAGTLFLTR